MPPQPGIPGQSSPFINAGGNRAPIRLGEPQNGSVIFSVEAVGILKKLEAEREARNKKRGERRAADEQGVSDDETDELSAYLMVVPATGENPGPAENADTPQDSTVTTQSSTLLFDDDSAARNTFQAHDTSIPAAVFSLARNGISPPLTLFMPTSLERIRSSNVKTVKHGTGESTKVTVLDVSDFPAESTLDQANWATTYNTFLTFLQVAVGPRIFQSFAQHYNRILSEPKLDVWFPAYFAFDQKIRAQFFTKPYIIDTGDAEYRSALQSAKDDFMWNKPSGGGAPGSGGKATSSRDREQPKPYDRESAAAQKRSNTLCFRCGRLGHNAHSCNETNPSKHGRQFVITAGRDGLFRISDKRSVCVMFNIGRCDGGAGAATRNHPLHICTLCGDAHHGASGCTRN
ncbi:hypothetical protein C8R46DRAFT_1047970 [Mycena filopes]|nr:hypothetical protein C8R46DRAFT_1047970 [Mycena filopes]